MADIELRLDDQLLQGIDGRANELALTRAQYLSMLARNDLESSVDEDSTHFIRRARDAREHRF